MSPPRLVVAGIALKDNSVLLIKRAREPFKEYWSFSGGCGAFEKTNDPVEAVKLELKWDTGCDFEPKFYTWNFADFNIPTVTLFFIGNLNGNPKSVHPECISECKWFSLEEADKLKLAFEHNTILKKIISEK